MIKRANKILLMVRKGRTVNSIRHWDEVYENEKKKKKINIGFGYIEVDDSHGEVSREGGGGGGGGGRGEGNRFPWSQVTMRKLRQKRDNIRKKLTKIYH